MGLTIKLAFFVSARNPILHGFHKRLLQDEQAIIAAILGARSMRWPWTVGLIPKAKQLLSFFCFRLLDRHRNVGQIRMRFERCLNHRPHKARLNRLRPSHLDGIPSPTCAVDFARLGGKPNIRSSLEAFDDVDGKTEKRFEQLG